MYKARLIVSATLKSDNGRAKRGFAVYTRVSDGNEELWVAMVSATWGMVGEKKSFRVKNFLKQTEPSQASARYTGLKPIIESEA